MGFVMGTLNIRGSLSLYEMLGRGYASEAALRAELQGVINEAAKAAMDEFYANVPIDTHALEDSGRIEGHNQFGFDIVADSEPRGKKEGPYGIAMEDGWHDRAGNFVPGFHMVLYASQVAEQVLFSGAMSALGGGAAGLSSRPDFGPGLEIGGSSISGMGMRTHFSRYGR